MAHEWTLAYASFTRRALARLIDLCVVLAICGVFYLVNYLLGFPLSYARIFGYRPIESFDFFINYDFPGIACTFIAIKLFVALPYFSLMESSGWQATLGKRALDLKVTKLDGSRLSFGRAAGRFLLKFISSLEFMLGYLISFSDQRQTLHDYLAGTLVLRRDVSPAFYKLPLISSRWMFDVPLLSSRTDKLIEAVRYQCLFCNHQAYEEHQRCPACGRSGVPPVATLKGLSLMLGAIFTIFGVLLAYVAFEVLYQRIIDDRLGREGAPAGVIFVIFLVAILMLAGGLSTIYGKKWLLRAIIMAFAGRIRGGV